ncbi:MAG: C40 family peptidase [Proteobacteria bacterium]|nr:C40 family peptidase [Pseudomonadota bacterium]
MLPMFDISNAVREAIVEHAQSLAPEEACGVVLGKDGGDRYVPCENVAEDRSTAFEIDAGFMAQARASGELRAIVHSHPHGLDGPSKTDMAQAAEDDVPWGIVVLDPVHRPKLFFWGDMLPVAPYEQRPFRHGIADCYALVRDWYRQERGLVLPLTPRDPDWWNKGQRVIEDNLHRFDFDAFGDSEPLQPGDVLLFQVGAPTINHTGIYVGNGLVLHHLTNRLSRKDVLGPWKQKYHARTMRLRPSALQPAAQSVAPEGGQ